MSQQTAGPVEVSSAEARRGRRFAAVVAVLLGLEALSLWGALGWLIFEAVTAPAFSGTSAVALSVLTGIVAMWVTATAVALPRRARWARGSAVTWQILQCAVAVGAVQGDRPDVGVAVAVFLPAVATLALILSKPMRAFLAASEDAEG
ncbi:MAG: hypothetical protein ACKOXM_01115 [Agromyces sp.]